MRRIWPWLLALLSGACMALTFPPFEVDGLAWFALAPLSTAVWLGPTDGKLRWLRLLGLGYATGLVFFLMAFSWLIEVTGPGWFVLCLYLALYPAIWALFAGTVGRPHEDGSERSIWTHSFNNLRLASRCAAAWVGLEWVRGTLFSGFGWNQLGVSQWQNVSIIQISDFAGIGGITFLIVLVNLIVVMTMKRFSLEVGRGILRPHYDFTITLALVAAAFLYGVHRFQEDPGVEVPLGVAAVQANIPQDQKWNPEFERRIVETYRRLTDQAIAFQPDLLIWPEAAMPFPLLQNEGMQNEASRILARLKGDFLLGTLNMPVSGEFNAAVLLDSAGNYDIYHKIHLVPFGEYVPLRDSFPLFAWIVGNQVPSDFDAGTEPVVMRSNPRSIRVVALADLLTPEVRLFPTLPPLYAWASVIHQADLGEKFDGVTILVQRDPVNLAPLICFEDTVGELVREFSGRGAELLVTLTNDGWFRESAGSRQHLANAVLSAASTKLPLVRAANTGVTCFVDRLGRVRQQLESPDGSTFIEGVLLGQIAVPVQPAKTLYTRIGDLFSIACLFAALLSIRTFLVAAPRRGLSEN